LIAIALIPEGFSLLGFSFFLGTDLSVPQCGVCFEEEAKRKPQENLGFD
jgi:hypothetical protein